MQFNLLDLIKYYFKNYVLALVIFLLVCFTGILYMHYGYEQQYIGTTTMMLGARYDKNDNENIIDNLKSGWVQNYIKLITSNKVLKMANEKSKLNYTEGQLHDMVNAYYEEETLYITIEVTSKNKKDSAMLSYNIYKSLIEEVERIFVGMGYEVVEGPEVEYADYNFTKLNIPENHPARDEQDTFFINDSILLRSQTSPVQARTMEKGKLPIRMIAPGRVFRSDEVDATHSPSFHQIEGLVIDKNITFADLKGTLQEFAQELFGPETKTKFRPHHFPFTEPSAEVDVSCFKCGGTGCRFCKGSGWIEILGCGMVHPNVLSMCGIDPEEYSGFAFGVGLERIALLKYEIDDMRLLYENDIRFLKQF